MQKPGTVATVLFVGAEKSTDPTVALPVVMGVMAGTSIYELSVT